MPASVEPPAQRGMALIANFAASAACRSCRMIWAAAGCIRRDLLLHARGQHEPFLVTAAQVQFGFNAQWQMQASYHSQQVSWLWQCRRCCWIF